MGCFSSQHQSQLRPQDRCQWDPGHGGSSRLATNHCSLVLIQLEVTQSMALEQGALLNRSYQKFGKI